MAQQGAGLVNAIKVLESTIELSPSNINLNDTVHFQGEHSIIVTNQGDETATYEVRHEPGVTTHARDTGDAWIRGNPPYSTGEGVEGTVVLSETSFTLAAGESITIKATFAEPADIDAKMLPLYGGGIVVSDSRGDENRVTYMGIKGSLYAADVWELERGVPLYVDRQGQHYVPFEEGLNYTFEGWGPVPQPYFNVLFSTREISFEFVARDWNESDWAYPVVPGQNKVFGSMKTVPQGLNDVVTTFPIRNYPRNSGGVYAQPSNVYAHGEEITPGEYRLLGRTLRTFGDPTKLEDWQWKLSPWFRVTREKPPPPTTTSLPPPPPATPTVYPTRPCTEDTRRVDITVRVGADETPRQFYRYSDLLAVDLRGTATPLDFELAPEDRVVTPDAPNPVINRFWSTHSNNNSLVYLRRAGEVTGAWTYMTCAVACVDRLRCRGEGDKDEIYICDSTNGVVRSGPEIPEGCQKLHLFVEELACPPAVPSAVPTVIP